MKISYSWLKNYLHLELPAEEIAQLLTNTGLEVEGIEEVEIGVTSVDVLMHLSANEMSCGMTLNKIDRRLKLMSHMIDQRTYYPLYPAHDNLCVDWIKAEFDIKML